MHRDPQKFIFPYKQVSGRNGDHEWLRMTNAFILCDLVWKVQKRYVANREGSFVTITLNSQHVVVVLTDLKIKYIKIIFNYYEN